MISSPEQRRGGLRRLATRLGYEDDMIRWEFPAWVGTRVLRADMVAFGRGRPQPQDQTTSALAGFDIDGGVTLDDAFSIARALAAPAAAVAGDDGIDLWSLGTGEQREHMRRLSYDRVDELPDPLADQLGPRNLLAAKRSSYQQALFPTDVAGLLQEARRESASRLVDVIDGAAAHLAAERMLTAAAQPSAIETVSRLLVGAMTALMVSDKVEVDRDRSPEAVLETAVQRFGTYFAWTHALTERDRRALLWTIEELGRDVSYAGLDPTIAASVYESAILDTASRAKFGVHYTPPALASRMLDLLPIEEIEPQRRRVLDPTCGSGTFLVAAYDRLRDIAPLELDLVEAHEDASHRLMGIDLDPLAVEIARLALLLNAMPAGNGWRIERGDALQATVSAKASVVVSNPPWGDIRSHHGRRVQVADRFIRRMLTMVQPNGFLATVLPAGWLSSRTSKPVRREIEAECGLLEVWRMPQDTFPRADVDVAVVLAQRDRPAGSYVFRRVRRSGDWKARFLEQARNADEVYLASAKRRLRQDTWLHGPLDVYRDLLAELPTLASIALVGKGPVPSPPVKERGGSGDWLWLRKLSGTRAYVPVPRTLLMPVDFPGEFKWRTGDGSEYKRAKVMVSGVRNPDIPWRLKVLPDLSGGIIPRESVSIVVPNEQTPEQVHALCALLGSSFASCWIDVLSARSIPIDLLKAMPIPADQAAWEDLAAAGARIVDAATEDRLCAQDLAAVDRLVAAAYGLPGEAFAQLAQHFAGVPAPEGGLRYPARDAARDGDGKAGARTHLRAFGTVLDVRCESIRIWVSGVTAQEGEWSDLPPGFPGSQVRPGATFEVVVDEDTADLSTARFEFQSESYLDFDDFLTAETLTP
jgi:SAM-dependent methyltransferase